MVSGVNHCANYAQCDDGGLRTIKSAYQIQALHMKFNYFMEHTYDPAQQCLTFHLDYDRKSDLDDSVGYWYVQPTSPDACRVYYSCECKLRGWVPGPVYDMLTKKALQQATTWVSAESLKEWDGMRDGRGRHGNGMVRFVGATRDSLDGAADRKSLLRRPPRTRCAGRRAAARRRPLRLEPAPRALEGVGRPRLALAPGPEARGLSEEGRGGSGVPCAMSMTCGVCMLWCCVRITFARSWILSPTNAYTYTAPRRAGPGRLPARRGARARPVCSARDARAHFGFRSTMMTLSPRRNILEMKRSLLTGFALRLPFPVFGTSVHISDVLEHHVAVRSRP